MMVPALSMKSTAPLPLAVADVPSVRLADFGCTSRPSSTRCPVIVSPLFATAPMLAGVIPSAVRADAASVLPVPPLAIGKAPSVLPSPSPARAAATVVAPVPP